MDIKNLYYQHYFCHTKISIPFKVLWILTVPWYRADLMTLYHTHSSATAQFQQDKYYDCQEVISA